MSTSSSSSAAFTGSSQFAADLQQVLTRSVGIASLPITQLNNTVSTLQKQSTALTGLDQKVAALQSAVTSLQSSLNSGLLSTSSSNAGVVNPSVSAGATPGDYSIEVVNIGSNATALSQAGSTAVTTPSSQGLSTSQGYTLTVGGTSLSISTTSSSLNDLADAINTQASGTAQATVINVGSSASPDYRLSLKSTKLGDLPIDLSDGTTSLISSQTTGSLATYKVAGQSAELTSDSRSVTLAQGLSVNLVSASATGVPTVITVQQDSSGLQGAFSNLASAYNAVSDALAAQHGTSAGALQGQSILTSISSTLRQLGGFSGGSASSSLAAFGITLDSSGHLNVDSSTFSANASTNFSTLKSLLGSTTTSGFLYSATTLLNGLEDSTTGTLKLQEKQVTKQITSSQNQITAKQSQVDQLQANLQAQLAKADAAIAALEQQVTYYTNMFSTQRSYNNVGY